MPRLRVVFDTNVYRNISNAAFDKLVARERAHGILGMASFWVVMELLAHVADSGDPDFQPSLAAVRRLHLHCSEYDGSRILARFIGDSEEHASIALFNRRIPGRREQAEIFGGLLGLVATGRSPADWAGGQEQLDIIRRQVATAEAEFAANMWQMIILPLRPDATSWSAISSDPDLRRAVAAELNRPEADRLAARLIVDKAAGLLGVTVTEEEREQKITTALRLFLIPVRLQVQILRKIVESGYDPSQPKNANTLWDMQIAFSTSPRAVLFGEPLWLVSQDRPVLAAAREAGATRVVRSWADYNSLVSQSTEKVAEHIRQNRPQVGRA